MVQLAHKFRRNRPQLGQDKNRGIEDTGVASNIRRTLVFGELVCNAVEGLYDVAELCWFTLDESQYPRGQGSERSYTSVLNSTKTLFQIGEVRQELQQRADGSTFTVIMYLLNGVKTLIDVPGQGELKSITDSIPTHLISKSGLPSNSRNLRNPNFVLVLFKIPSNDPSTL